MKTVEEMPGGISRDEVIEAISNRKRHNFRVEAFMKSINKRITFWNLNFTIDGVIEFRGAVWNGQGYDPYVFRDDKLFSDAELNYYLSEAVSRI